jgi:FKBP-type peptidyl-prolyl cis-trans isomerase FkpA
VRGILLALLALTALAASTCGYPDPYATSGPVANESPGPAGSPSPSPGADDFNAGAGLPVVTYPDGLKVIDLVIGTGAAAVSGENLTVQYTGWLSDATKFDTSRGRGPFTFQLGKSKVIAGWDEGLQGMKVGGKRKLIIPSALAYGPSGQQDPNTGAQVIPPNATLVFVVELTKVGPGPSPSPIATPTPTPSPSPSPSKSP